MNDNLIKAMTDKKRPTICKQWAMPSSDTFSIKPISEFVRKYVSGEMVVVDPFAGKSSIGTITNDLNQDLPTTYHMGALEFLQMMGDACADAVLFDPPYSPRQASECYKRYGREYLTSEVTNWSYWRKCKDEVARITKMGGVVLHFGWNTNGCGKSRGFEQIEILIVSHGGGHNDTLCLAEKKIG